MKSKFQFRLMMALMGMLLVCFLQAGAEDKPPACAKGYNPDGTPIPQPCNGISVGAPKVFDNRTLTLMLESLSQALQAQQQNYMDQKSVAAALANIQGFTQTETDTNLSLTATPTPATDVKTTLNTGNVNASGTPLPNTFQRQTDVNRASVTPQVPALDTAPAFQGFSPTYGNSASDLLSDQVNLTYQIFNLRMILERALSDRLNPDATGYNRTRRQAVLGFNVTLDPPRIANDAVAVVEITLQTCDKKTKTCEEEAKKGSKDEDGKPLSLVALMPQEKTYNAAALSSKSNAFAGSAVVSHFQVGFSARKRGQIFYLYRDNDTISYERMTGDPTKIVFGWMFRPVLGRRSISPGLRQLFAIMALPSVDCTGVDFRNAASADSEAKADSTCKEHFQPHLISNVRTYWKKYDRGTLTSFERRDANRAKEFWYGLSLTLAEPQIFDQNKYLNQAAYTADVRASSDYEHELRPTVSDVTWRPTGAKNVVISARGNNFFSQTKVALGDTTYADGSGLILKSNQAFDLVTTLDALVNGPGTIIGRYDIGAPLIKLSDLPPGFGDNGVRITGVDIHPSLGGHHRIDVSLQGIPSDDVVAQDRAARTHLVQIRSNLQEIEKRQQMVVDAIKAQQAAKNNHAALFAQKNLTAMITQFGDLATLQSQASSARAEVESAQVAAEEKHRQLVDSWTSNGLGDLNSYSPVISVNGKALELPYYKTPAPYGGTKLQAEVSDSDLADGGGVVKVSWPFYPADKWTVSAPFFNPDLAYEVTRVSSKSIVIHRKDGPSFIDAPEIPPGAVACWKLIAGDTEMPLTAACPPAKPAPKDCEKKVKDDPCAPPPLGVISDYTVTATVADLPDKVVLVAPSGSVYNLTVPPLKAKDDKTVPIELKQYDSQWIEIKASELTTGAASATDSATAAAKGAKDFSGLTAVEANNGPVNYVLPEADPKVLDEKTKKPKPPASVKVEITRALTSKPGTVDLAFVAGKKLIGTRQIHIAQTEWGNKGDK